MCSKKSTYFIIVELKKFVCMENYSDGLEKLITNRISVLSELELLECKGKLSEKISESFKKLQQKSLELGFSYYSSPQHYSAEISNLKYWLEDRAHFMKNYKVYSEYEEYLCWRCIFSVIVLCPAVLAREKVYDYWQYCVKNHVF